MLDEGIKVFLTVAQTRSFNQAAVKLFISPTAVMKRINKLENQIGVKLFERTRHGVCLTAAGEVVCREMERLSEEMNRALLKTLKEAGKAPCIVRVGNSLRHPCGQLLNFWNRISGDYPQFKVKIVECRDDMSMGARAYEAVGRDFDILAGAYDEKAESFNFSVLPMGKCHFCIAVPIGHPFYGRRQLLAKELSGEKLLITKSGNSPCFDSMKADICRRFPGIQMIEYQPHYDIEIFNQCEISGIPLVSLDIWSHIHPALGTIPVDWDYTIPYGVMYPKNPSESTRRFMELLRQEYLL